MSQSETYLWKTNKLSVKFQHPIKWHILLLLIALWTLSTVCLAEVEPEFHDITASSKELPTREVADTKIDFRINEDDKHEVPNDLSDAESVKQNAQPKTGFIDAFTASISVILFTELGDKTFFIAAIMAMRHPRLIVFGGALSALALMTVLSVMFGMAATIIPKVYTYYISTALFAVFGLKMIYEGYFMKDTEAQEELEEVQSNLRKCDDEKFHFKFSGFGAIEHKHKDSSSYEGDGNDVLLNPITNKLSIKYRHHHRAHASMNHINNNNNDYNFKGDHNKKDDALAYPEHYTNNAVYHGRVPPIFYSSPTLMISHSTPQVNHNNCTQIKRKHHASSIDTYLSRKVSEQDVGIHSPINSITKPKITSASKLNSFSKLDGKGEGVAGAFSGQWNGELKRNGDNDSERLERDVTAALIQDPESGILRKNTKKGAAYVTTRVLMQAFTMTFLAEWGDRSQLTTIILAASKDVYGVITGGIIGHSICTGLAVVGGRIVAAKISLRTVTIVGGIVFLGFALYALIVPPDDI